MGWKLKKVELRGKDQLKPNEEKDLCIILRPERRAAIHGVVKFPNGKPVKDAVVKLFKARNCDDCDLVPVTFTFTDECGQFLFGVDSGVDYIVKVFFYKPEQHEDKGKCDDDC